jgi:anti-anti-sigma regulatory factor
MLRITIFDTPLEQRLVVEGKLTGPWVPELEAAWKKTRSESSGRRCIVDLSETTVIDQSGNRILIAMCNQGVQFIGHGVATLHLISEIQRKCSQPPSSRGC